MSPDDELGVGRGHSFPRVSGDEPSRLQFQLTGASFSPRERG